jgi:lipid II:glycine glycyltransferase (peptidoglycan interpeptide bridge formation enzyme)
MEQDSIPFEIRHEVPSLDGIFKARSHYIHLLELHENPDEVYRRFRKKGVQYCIKKAMREGVDVMHKEDFDSLLVFYNLLAITRKKLGVPIQPRKYFVRLWQHIINQGMGFIILAYNGARAIAGGVFLHFNNKVIYKYGATDPAYLSLFGNHAVLWEAIRWSCQNRFTIFDWGKTDKSNEGLRNFKLGWGTEENELPYSYIGKKTIDYSTGWAQKVGKITIRKTPKLVGRLIGELLYKHVG